MRYVRNNIRQIVRSVIATQEQLDMWFWSCFLPPFLCSRSSDPQATCFTGANVTSKVPSFLLLLVVDLDIPILPKHQTHLKSNLHGFFSRF